MLPQPDQNSQNRCQSRQDRPGRLGARCLSLDAVRVGEMSLVRVLCSWERCPPRVQAAVVEIVEDSAKGKAQ